MKEVIGFIEKMKAEIFQNACDPIKNFQDRSKQNLLCEAIKYIDFLFESDTTYSHSISTKTANLIEYGIPSLMQISILEDKNIAVVPLIPSSLCMKNEIKQILDELEIYGLIETCEKYVRAGMLKLKSIDNNQLQLVFTDKYHDLERMDRVNTVLYSNNILYSLMPYNIAMLDETIINSVLDRMNNLVYRWQENYIGYGADEKVDDYFIQNAVIDLIQDADWNCFEQKDKFGEIEYEVFVAAVLLLESISIKHVQFVYLALDKYPDLDKYNLLPVFETKQTICESLQYFLDIDERESLQILDVLSLKQNEIESLKDKYLPLPPFLEIAKDYFIRSYAGCLYEPISYLLFKLKMRFPKDWDKNIQKREIRFRQELYDLFPDELYIKMDRNIVLKKGKKIVTDVDACLYDKIEGNILFVQLKWQDTIYDSFNSMLSKKKNYTEKVKEWIRTTQDWIRFADADTISNYLQVKPSLIDKKKIYLLVIGRYNANYSFSEDAFEGAEYCQWFELQRIMKDKADLTKDKFKFIDLLKELRKLRERREQERKINSGIEYNGKKILYDGLFYNEN